jgi:hypothetical protein
MWSIFCFALGYGLAHIPQARLQSLWAWLKSKFEQITTP